MPGPNPIKQLQQLRKWQSASTKDLSKVVLEAQRNTAATVLQASTKNISTLKAQNKVYGEINDHWKLAAAEVDAWAKDITNKVAHHFHLQAVSEIQHQVGAKAVKSSVIQYDRDRAKQYFRLLHPQNSPHLAAVFTDKMSATLTQTLRNSLVATYRQATVEGWTSNQIQKRLQDAWGELARDFSDEKFVDVAGRRWDNARYLTMLVRTTTARVARESYNDTLVSNGDDYARIRSVGDSCPVCRAWDGLIYSISGADKSLPSFQQVLNSGMFHPNCDCLTQRVDEGLHKGELERQQNKENPDWKEPDQVKAYRDGDVPRTPSAPPKAPEKAKPVPAPEPEPEPEPTKPFEAVENPDDLRLVKKLGGSTGAELVEDMHGFQYVRKRGASAEHLRAEHEADRIYKDLGIRVPQAKLYETDQGPVKLAEFIPGQDLGSYMKGATDTQRRLVREQVQSGFAADGLLGNWDVIGLGQDNMLVDAKGKVWRIDNGGSLAFRAMGSKKAAADWNEYATDLWTMRSKAANAQTHAYFGDLSMPDVSRQLVAINEKKLLKSASPVNATILKSRLENAREIAQGALDMEHGNWAEEYVDQLSRHRMGIKQAGIRGRMAKELKQSPNDVNVVDENGISFDDCRTKSGFSSSGDPDYDKIKSAAVSINHHAGKGDTQYNQTTVGAALKLKPQIEKAAKSGDPKAKLYQGHLQKLEAAKTQMDQGKTATLPILDAYKGVAQKNSPSIVHDLKAYVDVEGGEYSAISNWLGEHSYDSWNGGARGYKWHVVQNRKTGLNAYWWKETQQSCRNEFEDLPGSAEAKTTAMTAYHAFVQEGLMATDFRYNDRTRRAVRLVRTEKKDVTSRYKLKMGQDGQLYQRGANESSSIFRKTSIHGSETMVSVVPHHQVTAMYFYERSPGRGGGALLGDGENEFTFVPDGIPVKYAPSTYKFDHESRNVIDWELEYSHLRES